MSRRAIRRQARDNAVALLQVNLETADGDLWLGAEDYDDDEQAVFVDEVERIMRRVRP